MAKRIAQSTNTGTESESSERPEDGEHPPYKVGDFVRCTFSEDGIDYEALIVSIDGDQNQCTVQYLGYGNVEVVDMDSLVKSWGKKERAKQEALTVAFSEDISARKSSKGKAGKCNKRGQTHMANSFDNYRSSMMIPPPPPLPPHMDELSEDSEHLSAMLMSWYMSGYYTGLYQGRRQAATRAATHHE